MEAVHSEHNSEPKQLSTIRWEQNQKTGANEEHKSTISEW